MKIEPLERNQAAQLVQPLYDKLGERILNMFKVMAHRPNVPGPFLEFYKAVWAPGALALKVKELAYLRTSLMNGCEY